MKKGGRCFQKYEKEKMNYLIILNLIENEEEFSLD